MASDELMNAWCEAEARWHEAIDNKDTTDEEMTQALRAFRQAGDRWLEANA